MLEKSILQSRGRFTGHGLDPRVRTVQAYLSLIHTDMVLKLQVIDLCLCYHCFTLESSSSED